MTPLNPIIPAVASLILFAAALPSLRAQETTVPFHEPFDYPAGQLAGNGAWAIALKRPEGLRVGEGRAFGGHGPAGRFNSGSAARVNLREAVGPGATRAYFAVTLSVPGNTGAAVFGILSPESPRSNPGPAFIGISEGRLICGLNNTFPLADARPVLGPGRHRLVAKLEFDVVEGDKERLTVWANPTAEETAPAKLSVERRFRDTVAWKEADLILDVEGSPTGAVFEFDSIRVGATWAAVAAP